MQEDEEVHCSGPEVLTKPRVLLPSELHPAMLKHYVMPERKPETDKCKHELQPLYYLSVTLLFELHSRALL